jgi:hypothetical protein
LPYNNGYFSPYRMHPEYSEDIEEKKIEETLPTLKRKIETFGLPFAKKRKE